MLCSSTSLTVYNRMPGGLTLGFAMHQVEDWIIPFAAYTTAETPSVFQWARQPSKLPIAMEEGSWPWYNTWFLGPTRASPPNGISIGSAVFVSNTQTDTQNTLQSTSVVKGSFWRTACIWCGLKIDSSADEIANVNFFTTISHTYFRIPKKEPTSFNELDDS